MNLSDLMQSRGVSRETPRSEPDAGQRHYGTSLLIADPGIYDGIPEADYHADPCPEPSLSASLCKVLISQSPLHTKMAHPRLNPNFEREERDIFDRGTIAHALLLQGVDVAVVLDFDDWRTKEARASRDAARSTGKLPILRKHWDDVQAMVESAREQLARHKEASDAFTNGKPEQVLIWQEDNGVWCRARLDWLHDSRLKIDDYKSTGRNANPDDLARTFENDWEIQAAFYRRGILKLTGNDPQFRFVPQENMAPYAVSVVELGADWRWIGDEKVEYCIKTFGKCLESGWWPGYKPIIHMPELPKWVEEKWLRRTGRL